MHERRLSRRDFVSHSAIVLPLAVAQQSVAHGLSPDNTPLLNGFSRVIDCHAHVGVDYTHRHVTATAEDCVAMMDRCGIERACGNSGLFALEISKCLASHRLVSTKGDSNGRICREVVGSLLR